MSGHGIPRGRISRNIVSSRVMMPGGGLCSGAPLAGASEKQYPWGAVQAAGSFFSGRKRIEGSWSNQMKRQRKVRDFNVIIERDAEGYFVGTVPALKGCHSQARSLDKLIERMREAIELCLDVEGVGTDGLDFVGVQKVTVTR